MIGLLGEAFDQAYDALAAEPDTSTEAAQYLACVGECSNWLIRYGWDEAGAGFYYGAQFASVRSPAARIPAAAPQVATGNIPVLLWVYGIAFLVCPPRLPAPRPHTNAR